MAIILCMIFIGGDILTGLLKAWKNKNLNSSVSRDGFIKKLGWIVGLILGYIINALTGMDLVIIITASTCMITEFISILENLNDIGVDIKKLKNYLDKAQIEETKETKVEETKKKEE